MSTYIKLVIYSIAFICLAYSIIPCLGRTFDSDLYLSGSENLYSAGLFHDCFKAKPPLYPILLVFLGNNLVLIGIFNLFCWTLSMFVIDKIIESTQASSIIGILTSLWVAFSTPIHLVHNFVWTEPLFLVLFLIFFLNLTNHVERNWLVVTLLAVAIVALRHMGIVFIFSGAIVLFINKNLQKKDWIWMSAGFGFFILWQAFVYYLRGDLSRLDHSTNLDIANNYVQLGRSMVHWIMPFDLPFITYLVPIFFVGLLVIGVIRSQNKVIQLLSTSALLTTAVILSKGELIYEDIERYLFFIHPFLFSLILFNLREKSRLQQISIGLMVLVLTYTIIRTVKNNMIWHLAFC